MGADGAATLGASPGLRTVVQPTTKLHVLQSKIIMGVSGQVGLGQLYCDRIESLWREKKLKIGVSLADVQRMLRDAVSEDFQKAWARASIATPILGNNNALELVGTQSLVALPVGGPTGEPELIQLDLAGNPEAAETSLPCVSIGSGQSLADPFLAFLRHIFWSDRLPNVAEGVFAVVWALSFAIDVNPGGVSNPIQLAVLERAKGKELAVRELSQEEIGEHRQMIPNAEEHLRSFMDKPSDSSIPIPEAPVTGEGDEISSAKSINSLHSTTPLPSQ